MFLANKYTTWYFNIVDNARQRKNNFEYLENHHVVPKSLGGGDSLDNLVYLTAKEHFVCHRLLTKMTTGTSKRKMSYALWIMCNAKNKFQVDRITVSSKAYEQIRQNHAVEVSLYLKGKSKNYSSFKGRKHSAETIEFFRSCKIGSKNPNFGVVQKPEWNEKKRDAQIGKSKPLLECPKCHAKVGGHGNFTRWHGDICRKENKNYS